MVKGTNKTSSIERSKMGSVINLNMHNRANKGKAESLLFCFGVK
jgi:hypothetical protein